MKETFRICRTLHSFKYNSDWRTDKSIGRAKKGKKNLKIKQTLAGHKINHLLQENNDDDNNNNNNNIIMPKSTNVHFFQISKT